MRILAILSLVAAALGANAYAVAGTSTDAAESLPIQAAPVLANFGDVDVVGVFGCPDELVQVLAVDSSGAFTLVARGVIGETGTATFVLDASAQFAPDLGYIVVPDVYVRDIRDWLE